MTQACGQLLPLSEEAKLLSSEEGNDHMFEQETENEATTHHTTLKPWVGRIAIFAVGCALLLMALWRFDSPRGGILAGSTEQIVQLSNAATSNEACEHMLDWLMQAKIPVKMVHYNFSTASVTDLPLDNASVAASVMKNPQTNGIRIGKCSPQEKSLVWFYPDTSGDTTGAFLLADGECNRMHAIIDEDEVDCVAIYRIPNAAGILIALNKFHGAGTISHAVIGGHGTDGTKNSGALVLSGDGENNLGLVAGDGNDAKAYDVSGDSAKFASMLAALRVRLAPTGTIFMDSCFAGINGVAKTVSANIPDHWVFGGVVEMTSSIKLSSAPFDGSSEGPVRVVNEEAINAYVLNIAAGRKAEAPSKEVMAGGFAMVPDEKSGSMVTMPWTYYGGERILGYYGGENQGSVVQWLRPSHNKKVIRAGLRVRAREELGAYRSEIAYIPKSPEPGVTQGFVTIDATIYPGMNGTVVFMANGGQVVTSGNAMIIFDLPSDMSDTLNAGATTGPVTVLSTEFGKLDVVEDASAPPVPPPTSLQKPQR